MKRFLDISEWYTQDQVNKEDVGWVLERYYARHLDFALPRMKREGVKSIIEVGCGTGLVALGLPDGLSYLGVDRCEMMLKRARARNPDMDFACRDARNIDKDSQWDLAMAWSFMKHFGLEEWDDVLSSILSHARCGAFNVQTFVRNIDTGTDFHHVFVREDRVAEAARAAGHEVVEKEATSEWQENGETARDVMFWTRRT